MKIKANILLITLFLLMMSSLSALLVTAYIRNLIKLSASFHDYYRAYYVASAWLELSLIKTNGKVRGYGFEDSVSTTSEAVTSNFNLGEWWYFNTVINTKSHILWGSPSIVTSSSDVSCGSLDSPWRFEISPWWCVPFVLLADTLEASTEWILQQISPIGLRPFGSLPNISLLWNAGATVLITQMDPLNLTFEKGRSIPFSATDLGEWKHDILSLRGGDAANRPQGGSKLVVMLTNTTATTWSYCLQSNVEIPTQYVAINAQWRYRNTILDLKWMRTAWLPADFCYTIINQ